MDLRVIERNGNKIVVGEPGVRLLTSVCDIVDVIGACLEQGTHKLLLYAENLSEGFFDLSSGEAGEILQKLRNYRIRLAVVASPDGIKQSSRFREMVLEEGRGGYFRIFEDRSEAEAWLVGE